MPTNHQTEDCIHRIRDALVFWSPQPAHPRLHGRVQIVDVFSLEVATGYSRDPHGRLLLHSAPSVAEGRSWSLAKAAQLIRNDARPHRWVALQQDKRAWGLFWAGGGLQRCRELLAEQINDAEACSALVPVSAERVLELVLSNDHSSSSRSPLPAGLPQQPILQWVALTSAVWLVILALISGGFLLQLERQTRTLEVLLERLEATDIRH
ncbi:MULTISPECIES: hypothetical protein [unclassified Synechococcus]|uniref:hypothetical protein n=1 Tax=unclassified Synechococcus TaxID=2626047 RepID=UPI000068F631|nr:MULTISPECIES: hypothetical protein [unclassified Synechococcus]EAQ69983.1 hypothetical protein RS9917_11116 [Synechococcus sp. RS9917]